MKLTASDFFTRDGWTQEIGGFDTLRMADRIKFRRTKLRTYRRRAGLTLEAVAPKVGITPSHLSMMERGDRQYTQEIIEALAKIYKTDPLALVEYEDGSGEGIIPLWNQASPSVRLQLIEIAKTLTKPRS